MKRENFIHAYGEWIFRIVLLTAMCIQLYLTRSFVTRPEFEKSMVENSQTHLMIQTSVSDIATSLKILSGNTAKLEDHETRIRLVENRQIMVLEKIHTLETK